MSATTIATTATTNPYYYYFCRGPGGDAPDSGGDGVPQLHQHAELADAQPAAILREGEL